MQQDPELLKGEGSLWNDESEEITMTNSDFVLVNKNDIKADPALHRLASEIGIKEFVGALPANGTFAGVPIDVLSERVIDTVEDIWQYLRRIPYEKGIKTLSPEEEETRKTVVVLGSGWAAHALMKVADCNKLRIIVVSPSNHFVFTPMLASAAVGTVEYRSMTEAVRSANPMIHEYIEGQAVNVNVQDKKVKVQLNSLLQGVREGTPPVLDIDYDHLVVSVGCRVDDKGVPGADKAAMMHDVYAGLWASALNTHRVRMLLATAKLMNELNEQLF